MDRAISSKKINIGILAAIGVLLGAISIISPGTVFDIVLAVVSAMAVYYFSDSTEKHFLIKIFIAGLLLRVILLLLFQSVLIHNGKWFWVDVFGGRATYMFGDDGYYTLRGWGLTQHITGVRRTAELVARAYEVYGYTFYLYINIFN